MMPPAKPVTTLKLHGFFNSSASYRVRIALNLKGLAWTHVGVNIRAGVQDSEEYKALNPIALVPTLQHNDQHLTQSLAIIDYLDRLQPAPRMIPAEGANRDRVLEIALLIACDVHPLNNLRVLKFLTGPLKLTEVQKNAWAAHWMATGFDALEALLPDHDGWSVGSAPTLADCCLVPQVANARRLAFDLAPYPRIRRIEAFCQRHSSFASALPSAQPDFIPA